MRTGTPVSWTVLQQARGDVIVENRGEGTDSVQSRISHTLDNLQKNLTLIGSDNLNAYDNMPWLIAKKISGANGE